MDRPLVIQPRIEVFPSKGAAPDRIEVSFSETEVTDNKDLLKKEVGGEIVPVDLGYASLSKLLDQIKKEIAAAKINQDHIRFGDHNFISGLEQQPLPTLKMLFQVPQPVWEGYTTREHSLAVMMQLAVLVFQDDSSSSFKHWLWQVAGALHDLGKGVAAYFEKDAKRGRKNQDRYNRDLAQCVLEALGFEPWEVTYILTLIVHSGLPYLYVSGEISSADEVWWELVRLTKNLQQANFPNAEPLKLLDDLKQFWVADGSSYSAVTGVMSGLPLKPSFDDQFVYVFTLHGNAWQLADIKLKPSWQRRYDGLVKELKSKKIT